MNLIQVDELKFPTVKIQLDTWETYMAGATKARNLRNKMLIDFYHSCKEIGQQGLNLESFASDQTPFVPIITPLKNANFDTYIESLELQIQSMLKQHPKLKLEMDSDSFQIKFSNFLKSMSPGGSKPSHDDQIRFSKLERQLENAQMMKDDFTRLSGQDGIPLFIKDKFEHFKEINALFNQSISVTFLFMMIMTLWLDTLNPLKVENYLTVESGKWIVNIYIYHFIL